MRTTIDKAGRVVIPRRLREQAGLLEAGDIEVAVDGSTIRIEAAATGELVDEQGFLVVPRTGRPISQEAVRRLIDADRNART